MKSILLFVCVLSCFAAQAHVMQVDSLAKPHIYRKSPYGDKVIIRFDFEFPMKKKNKK